MHTGAKIWLIIAAVLIALGAVAFVVVMSALQWDFSKLSTTDYETNTHAVEQPFHHITVDTSTADIAFLPSEDDACTVVCRETSNVKHTVAVENDTLTIREMNDQPWYEYIGIAFGTPSITVYLPQETYGALTVTESTGDITVPQDFSFDSIDITASTGDISVAASAATHAVLEASTGDITVENVRADSMTLSVTTGKVIARSITCAGELRVDVSTGDARLESITCDTLASDGDTGEIAVIDVIVAGKLSIERDTGDIVFKNSDADKLFIKTSTGSVTGTLLSEKVFVAESNTGDVRVPHSTSGGKCEIITDTGDVRINIAT